MRTRTRILAVLALAVSTACSAVLGVPDLYLDENAFPGGGDATVGTDGTSPPNVDSSSGGLPDATTTCNADLKTDPKNCGACNHDCTNGLCADGICTLAINLASPTHLAVRGNAVYFGLQGDDGILSCPTNGCANAAVAPKKLNPDDAGSFQPNRVAANDTHVFAADYYTGTANRGRVLRVPIAGGPMTRVPPTPLLERSYAVALDNNAVYWTEIEGATAGIYACVLPTCPTAVSLAAGGTPELIAVATNGAIVWSDGDMMRCTSRTACTATKLVTGTEPAGICNDLMIDGTTAYWGTNLGGVHSCAATGCANATTHVDEMPKATIGAVAASGNLLAWSSMPFNPDGNSVDDTAGVIKSCTLPNCAATTKTIATGQKDPTGMAIDATSIYWVNSGKRGFTNGIGTMMKAPR